MIESKQTWKAAIQTCYHAQACGNKLSQQSRTLLAMQGADAGRHEHQSITSHMLNVHFCACTAAKLGFSYGYVGGPCSSAESMSVCADVEAKEDNLKRMGMEGIISDMRASKARLLAKYSEAYSAAQRHLADVAAVQAAVDQACTASHPPASAPQPPARSVRHTWSMQSSTVTLRCAFLTVHQACMPSHPHASAPQPSVSSVV